MLTVVVPTRNRWMSCAAQLRLYRDSGLCHRILVADSSADGGAEQVRIAAAGLADYRHFSPTLRLVDKLLQAVPEIRTPFTVITPDDDVTMPDAIDLALTFLQANADFVAAHGYILDFASFGADVDIYGVSGFTPTIDEADPLRRHYHLMRRYQPFYWGVFRTEMLVTALTAARPMQGIMFRELTVMNVAILQGKVARLPVIYQLRSDSQSLTSIQEKNPLHWFLHDASSMLDAYRDYRENLNRHVLDISTRPLEPAAVMQFLDLVHAIFLQQQLDAGVLNHVVRRMLGDPIPAVPLPPGWPGGREPESGDVVRVSPVHDRRYVWRERVLRAEPRDEIVIGPEQMAAVERQFDYYALSEGSSADGP